MIHPALNKTSLPVVWRRRGCSVTAAQQPAEADPAGERKGAGASPAELPYNE